MGNEYKTNKNITEGDSPCIIPIVDAHMHIQSNDVAPLPIMNGILRLQMSKKGIQEGKINFCELSFRKKLNKHGDYSYDFDPDSNDITFNNKKIKNGVSWSIDSVNIENRETLTDAVAGFSFSLSLPNGFIGLLLSPITAFLNVTKYGQVARQCSFLIADLYKNQAMFSSLAYPSRWVSNFYSLKSKINSFFSYIERKILVFRRNDKVSDKYIGWYRFETLTIRGFLSVPKISCIMGMDLMYAHYWGVYGIPIYIYSTPYEPSEIINDKIYTIDNFPQMLNFPYDLKQENIENSKNISQLKQSEFAEENKYNLFLKEIPLGEKLKFENHAIHVEYQKIATLKYPLSFLPFYHVDPRRFFSPELTSNNKNSILDNFNFYLKDENSKYVNSNHKIKFFLENDTNKFSVEKIYRELLIEVDGNIDNSQGLFWGIKLYAALGYPPYIGTENETTYKVYPLLKQANSYKAFTAFLEKCADNNIPITCHCSPQGMTIADSEIYLKEYLKKHPDNAWTSRKKSNFEPSTRGMLLGLGLIDDFSSPKSWEIVLSEIKTPLTLCLAHFGGKPFFVDDFKMMTNEDINGKDDSEIEEMRCNDFPYSWQIALAQLISNSKHNIYTDLSNYMFDKIIFPEKLSEVEYNKIINVFQKDQKLLINKYFIKTHTKDYDFYKVNLELNDLTYYYKNDSEVECYNKKQAALQIRFAMLEVEIVGKQINRAAEKLAKLIKNYDKLKYRIMYGTDFPMFETKVHGVPNYQVSTFIFYQLLSHKLCKLGIKIDAWHQFCVINPLRFLGLLCEKGGKMYFDLKKIEIMKEHLLNFNESLDDKLRKKYTLGSNMELKNSIKDAFNGFTELDNKVLLNADEIIDKDGNLILTGE